MLEIKWLVAQRVILTHFSGTVTVEDHKRAVETILAWGPEGIAPVHIISIHANITSYPTLAMLRTQNPTTNDGRYGYVVLVSDNKMLNFFGSMLSQFSGTAVVSVPTTEKALEYLRARDAALDAQMKTLLS
jgi:hypothetical protein